MDNDIKDFFKEIRKLDDDIDIPAFEEINIKKHWFRSKYYVYAGAAASFLILLNLYFNNINTEKTNISEDIEYVIWLSDYEETNTKSLITEEVSIYSWKASSESLINNFNE